jgi:hypothetical protein
MLISVFGKSDDGYTMHEQGFTVKACVIMMMITTTKMTCNK